MYKVSKTKSGVKVVTHPMRQRDSVSIGFWVGVGGRYESAEIKGVAHFLEHILFKGTDKYGCEEIKEKIEGVGGALNAFTSEEQTCYYAKIPSKYLNQTFDVLSDMIISPKILKKDVDKERTVIMEEIKMYHDLPQYFVLELLDELMWPNHPLGSSLAGSLGTVKNMTNKTLKSFHKHYYAPENVVVACAGKIKHDDLLKLVEKKFKVVKKQDEINYHQVDESQVKAGCRVFKKDIEQSHISLGMLGYDENNDDRYQLSILNVILGGNMSSRLFVEVREKRGLAYSISSSLKALHDTGVFMVRAGVENAKVVDAVSLIKKELLKVSKNGVKQAEFKRAKDYLIGQLRLGLEDTMDHMLWIGEDLVSKGSVRGLNKVVDKLKSVTLKDVNRVARDVINPKRFNLAIVGPVSKEQEKKIKSLIL